MEGSPILRRGKSVTSAVGAYVERLIEEGLAPGDRLPPERELASLLNVSRSSVRAALRELEQRRRIERTPGRGTTVLARPQAAAELRRELQADAANQADAAELRLVVEPQIAGLAAARATDADIVLLQETLSASHAGLTPRESLEMDVRFHLQLAGAAGNPLLLAVCETANGWVEDVRIRSHASRAGRRRSVDGHRTLFQAVAARDSEAAIQAMINHLQVVERLVADSDS